MGRLTVSAVPVLNDNYVWLITRSRHDETAAVDPSVTEPVLEAADAQGLRITQVLNTHWHPDHTGGNQGIKAATGCTDHRPGRSRAGQQDRPHRRRRRSSHGRRCRSDRVGHSRPHRRPHRFLFRGRGHDLRRRHDVRHGLRAAVRGHRRADVFATCSGSPRCPSDVRIYCGHEYTLANARFAQHADRTMPRSRERLERVDGLARGRDGSRSRRPSPRNAPPTPSFALRMREEFARLRAEKDSFR